MIDIDPQYETEKQRQARLEKERSIINQETFRFVLTNDEIDIFLEKRRVIAKEIDETHTFKKEAVKNKNFELAKFIDHELIRPKAKLLKAFDIAKFILITGVGNLPIYPFELFGEIRQVNNIILYEIIPTNKN